jgi:hypothetical protein
VFFMLVCWGFSMFMGFSIPCPLLEWDTVKSWSVQVMKGNNCSTCCFIKLSLGSGLLFIIFGCREIV